MDFSDFSDAPAGAKGTGASHENFTHAYISVAYWNVATSLTLALPVAAYGYALHQEPEYLGDHTWEWSFEFSMNSLVYSATLTAKRLSNEEFSAEMVIGLALIPEQGVKWFDGIVRYDHTHAAWNLYKEGSVKIIEAAWNHDFETEAADLTYTYVEPGQEETGSYIMLAHMPQEVYDASYTISLANNLTNIEWNITTKEGRVKDPGKFGDIQWHCWDEAVNGLMDMVCR